VVPAKTPLESGKILIRKIFHRTLAVPIDISFVGLIADESIEAVPRHERTIRAADERCSFVAGGQSSAVLMASALSCALRPQQRLCRRW
jgi:hypothetical protein